MLIGAVLALLLLDTMSIDVVQTVLEIHQAGLENRVILFPYASVPADPSLCRKYRSHLGDSALRQAISDAVSVTSCANN